jgi:dihydropteroate synthase
MSLDLPSGPLSLERVRVMGILNATPDSFYDRGRYAARDRAVARAVEMAGEGADIIDVGGEKAGPGEPVTAEEEIRRVLPVIEALRRELTIPLSVDTRKPEVARAAVEAGADIVNSIGGMSDPILRRTAADTRAAVVIMHIKGEPRVAHPNPSYVNVVGEIKEFLEERISACLADGIPANRIVLDPGPGFGKNTEQDLVAVSNIDALTTLPYPVLLAASRKKFIGDVLGASVVDRLEGSLAVVAWGVLHGVRLVRVHDVKASKRVCLMTEAVLDPTLVGVGP